MNDTSHDAFNAGVNGGFFILTGVFPYPIVRHRLVKATMIAVSLSEVSGEEGESSDFSEEDVNQCWEVVSRCPLERALQGNQGTQTVSSVA